MCIEFLKYIKCCFYKDNENSFTEAGQNSELRSMAKRKPHADIHIGLHRMSLCLRYFSSGMSNYYTVRQLNVGKRIKY